MFDYEELIKQFEAYEMGLGNIQSAHVEYIKGRKPRSVEPVLQEMVDVEG